MRYLLHTLPPSIPYTAAIHFFYQVLFEVLFHVYSWCEARCICTICLVLADLGIALVLSFCTAGLLGKIFFSLLAQSEYETGWAFHNVVSYY